MVLNGLGLNVEEVNIAVNAEDLNPSSEEGVLQDCQVSNNNGTMH